MTSCFCKGKMGKNEFSAEEMGRKSGEDGRKRYLVDGEVRSRGH